MKRYIILSGIGLILSLYPLVVYASHPLEQHCTSHEPPDLSYWVDKAEAIIIGKAVSVVSNPVPTMQNDGSCWARFEAKEWLKADGSKEIWIRSAISPRRLKPGDLESLRYCEFEAGKNYLVFGRYITTPSLPFPPKWIGTASNRGIEGFFHCWPNTLLDTPSPGINIDEVRQLIKKKE